MTERPTTTTRGIHQSAPLHLLLPSELEVEEPAAKAPLLYVVAAANFSCQQGPLNPETKFRGSSNEDGWLLLSDETWNYTQSLELISSLEPRAEAAFFNQVAPQASLILLANVKKNAIYVAHVEYGPDPASDRLGYITDFTMAMPILSLTGTHENQSDGEQAVQAYCVPRMVIQQYDLDLSLCSPPTADTTGFGRDLVISCVQEALLDVVGTELSGGTSFTDSYSLMASSKSPRVDQSAEFGMMAPSVPPLAYSEGDGSIQLPSAPLASKIELLGSRPMPRDAARHARAHLSAVVFLLRRTDFHHAIAEHATVKESSEETTGTEIAHILPPTAVRFKPGRLVESARLQLTQEPLRVAAQTNSASESNVKRQQSDECNLSFNVDGKQNADSIDNDRLLIPIFVRHDSGQLTLRVHLDQPSQNLMQLYAQKTKTKLGNQNYFVYGNSRLQPNSTLLSYGVQQDTTVHVCTRLLGGVETITLEEYVNNNRGNFMIEVALPDEQLSLQMTLIGCQFLSSWMNCFTTAFAEGKGWQGQFSLKDFKYIEGHILKIKKPTKINVDKRVAMDKDLKEFVGHVEQILRSDNSKLVSEYPPYLKSFTRYLDNLFDQQSRGSTDYLSTEDKIFLDTHVCCMTSYARERLIYELYRKYEGAGRNEAPKWHSAINSATCPADWQNDLSDVAFLKNMIDKADSAGGTYATSRIGAFRFMRDVIMHAEDHTGGVDVPKFGDGNELMLPAHLEDFLPSIIINLIKNGVDISAELLAAMKCACTLCDSASSSH